MNKAYLLRRSRRITLVYMTLLVGLCIYILLKLIDMYFISEISSIKKSMLEEVDSGMFSSVIKNINPSIDFFVDNKDMVDNQVGFVGNNIPLISFILSQEDKIIQYTINENYPDFNVQEDIIIETEDDYYDEDELYSTRTFKDETLQEEIPQEEVPQEDVPVFTIDQLSSLEQLKKNIYRNLHEFESYINLEDFPVEYFMNMPTKIDTSTPGPKILIYHTHSQESFQDTAEGVLEDTVVGIGDELTKILEEKYGLNVLHHRGVYDLPTRGEAYGNIAEPLQEILNQNPTIEILIDIHRDGGYKKVVTEVNGKDTARIMFVNGLALYKNKPNPVRTQNLAFSFQMLLKAYELYPDLVKQIHLSEHRYNMHLNPRTLLIEVGDDYNTKQEAINAMEPFAEILNEVIQ